MSCIYPAFITYIMCEMENPNEFVQWLRSVAPYIHAFRGKTFVVAFPGELVTAGALPVLAQDLSLLHALGIKVVIVHGSRPQVEEQLALRNVEARFHNGLRITDTAALECAKEAAGELRLDIEAAFSQGLPNTPMSNAHISIVSGNFVTARPLGVIVRSRSWPPQRPPNTSSDARPVAGLSIPRTATGRKRVSVVPSPSCPMSLAPQA